MLIAHPSYYLRTIFWMPEGGLVWHCQAMIFNNSRNWTAELVGQCLPEKNKCKAQPTRFLALRIVQKFQHRQGKAGQVADECKFLLKINIFWRKISRLLFNVFIHLNCIPWTLSVTKHAFYILICTLYSFPSFFLNFSNLKNRASMGD